MKKKSLSSGYKLHKMNTGGFLKRNPDGSINTAELGQYAGMASGLVDAIDPGDQYGVQSTGGALASGALSGAAAGSVLGPIGMGVGAVLGGATKLLGNNSAKKEKARQIGLATDKLQEKKEREVAVNIAMNPSIKGNSEAAKYRLGGTLKGKPAGKFAMKGTVIQAYRATKSLMPTVTVNPNKMAKGGIVPKDNEGRAEVVGPSHERGGVKIPALNVELEGGETVDGDFVFSKELGFADKHKKIMKSMENLNKDNSPLANYTKSLLNDKEEKLKIEQEETKQSLGIPNDTEMIAKGYKKFKVGGSVGNNETVINKNKKFDPRQAIRYSDWREESKGSPNPMGVREGNLLAQGKAVVWDGRNIVPDSYSAITIPPAPAPGKDMKNVPYDSRSNKTVLDSLDPNTPKLAEGFYGYKNQANNRGIMLDVPYPETAQAATPQQGAPSTGSTGSSSSSSRKRTSTTVAPKELTPKGKAPTLASTPRGNINYQSKNFVSDGTSSGYLDTNAITQNANVSSPQSEDTSTGSVNTVTGRPGPNGGNVGTSGEVNRKSRLPSASDVAPFVTNLANAFRKLPKAPDPTLDQESAPRYVDFSNQRNEANRQVRGANKTAEASLSSGNASSATIAANLTQGIRSVNAINEAESNANAQIANRTEEMNRQTRSSNNLKTDYKNAQDVARSLKQQELNSENLANLADKIQLTQRDKKLAEDEDVKLLLTVAQDNTGATWRAASDIFKKRMSEESYNKLDAQMKKAATASEEERQAIIQAALNAQGKNNKVDQSVVVNESKSKTKK